MTTIETLAIGGNRDIGNRGGIVDTDRGTHEIHPDEVLDDSRFLRSQFLCLRVFAADAAPKLYDINYPSTTIGRSQADIVVPDPSLAATHVTVLAESEGHWIEDSGSDTGTYLLIFGRRQSTRSEFRLHRGDAFCIGSCEFVVSQVTLDTSNLLAHDEMFFTALPSAGAASPTPEAGQEGQDAASTASGGAAGGARKKQVRFCDDVQVIPWRRSKSSTRQVTIEKLQSPGRKMIRDLSASQFSRLTTQADNESSVSPKSPILASPTAAESKAAGAASSAPPLPGAATARRLSSLPSARGAAALHNVEGISGESALRRSVSGHVIRPVVQKRVQQLFSSITLTATKGPLAGNVYKLHSDARITLGTDPSCSIPLPDQVSQVPAPTPAVLSPRGIAAAAKQGGGGGGSGQSSKGKGSAAAAISGSVCPEQWPVLGTHARIGFRRGCFWIESMGELAAHHCVRIRLSAAGVRSRQFELTSGDRLLLGSATRAEVLDTEAAGLSLIWHRLAVEVRSRNHWRLPSFFHMSTTAVSRLGRSSACDIAVNDYALNEFHAECALHGQAFHLDPLTQEKKAMFLLLGRGSRVLLLPVDGANGTAVDGGNASAKHRADEAPTDAPWGALPGTLLDLCVPENDDGSSSKAGGSAIYHRPSPGRLLRVSGSSGEIAYHQGAKSRPPLLLHEGLVFKVGSSQFMVVKIKTVQKLSLAARVVLRRHRQRSTVRVRKRSDVYASDYAHHMAQQSTTRIPVHPEALPSHTNMNLRYGFDPMSEPTFLALPHYIVLECVRGPLRRMVFGLDETVIIIGSSPDVTINLNDVQISRYNTLIQFRDDAYWLSDLESRNGTFLRIEPDSTHKIELGDIVVSGSTEFVFYGDVEARPVQPTSKVCTIM